MKNVLFIVYYFPPMGGSGVQRPLKFVKYLRDHGWNPIVMCPEPGAYHTFDRSLENELLSLDVEVHRVEAKTPFHRAGQSSKSVSFIPEWLAKPLRWISTFFWIPDNKTGWIKPGIREGMKIISEKKIDAIFSTAAPYSNLIIAKMLKRASGLPVIMDLRDDWLDSHLIHYPTPFHRNKMARIEKATLQEADLITVINSDTKEAIEGRHPSFENVKILNQGFDPADFTSESVQDANNSKLTFLYSGLFYGERKPDIFLQAIHKIAENNEEFRSSVHLEFQGGLESKVLELIEELNLTDLVEDHGYIDHERAVKNLLNADVLWLIVGHTQKANQVTVGKMFEYFGSRKPILGLVPGGSSKDLLNEYGAAYVSDPYKLKEVISQIEHIFVLWKEGQLPKPEEAFVKMYDRKEIAGELAELLEFN